MSKYRLEKPAAFKQIMELPGAKNILSSSQSANDKEKPIKKKESAVSIRVRDFMVYQNKFQCRSKSHKIKDIDASVRIVTDKGEDILLFLLGTAKHVEISLS